MRILEDSPYFNAGHGSVFSHAGINELDAAIMDGATQKAGAVAGVRHIRNPIDLARMVMERTSTCCFPARARRNSRSSRA